MIKLVTKLAQKPSDKTIRIVRVVFAFVLLLVIYFGWDVTTVNFGLPAELKYAFYIFPLVGLVRGISDPGVFRKKIWKWMIVSFGAIMILTSLFLIDDTAPAVDLSTSPSASWSGGISLVEISKQSSLSVPFSLSTDNWFWFFGFLLLIVGWLLNSKNITMKNERYGEIVKKIRV